MKGIIMRFFFKRKMKPGVGDTGQNGYDKFKCQSKLQ